VLINAALRCAVTILVTVTLLGCGSIVVEGWSVSCQTTVMGSCERVAAVALNNLGRGRPQEPKGIITIQDRRACPNVPEWADPSHCWQADIPLGPGSQPACLVIARRPQLGGYGQVAGDELSGLDTTNPQPGCPPE
jgi:hypothetical protein